MFLTLPLLFCAHLLGDFILQNDGMQAKSRCSLICTCHVAMYSLGFIALATLGYVPWIAVLIIVVQHWLQDRFALHLKWMKFFGHSTPDKWPVGPLCIDQAFHLLFIGILSLIYS